MGLIYYDKQMFDNENSTNTAQQSSSSNNNGTSSSNNNGNIQPTNELNSTNVIIASYNDNDTANESEQPPPPPHPQQHSVTFSEVASVYEPSPEFEFTSNNMQTYTSSHSNHESGSGRRGRRHSTRSNNRHAENEVDLNLRSNRSSRSNSRHSQRSNVDGPRQGILRRSRTPSRRSSSSMSSATTTLSSTVATYLNTYANSAIFYDDDDGEEVHEDTQLAHANSSSTLAENIDSEVDNNPTDEAINIPLNDTAQQRSGGSVHSFERDDRLRSLHRINNENALETLQNTLINSTVERDPSEIITSTSHQRTMSPPPPPPPEEVEMHHGSQERVFGHLQVDLDHLHLFNGIPQNPTGQHGSNEDRDDEYYRSYSEGDEFDDDFIMGEIRSLNVVDRDSIRIYDGYNSVTRIPSNSHRRVRIHRANRHLPSDNVYQNLLSNHVQEEDDDLLGIKDGQSLVYEKDHVVDQQVLIRYCNQFYAIFTKIKDTSLQHQKYSESTSRLNNFFQLFEDCVVLKNFRMALVIEGIWIADMLVRLATVKRNVDFHRELSIAAITAGHFVQSIDDNFEFNDQSNEYYPFYDETRVNYALGGLLKTCIPSNKLEMQRQLREFVREQFNPGDYIDLKRSNSKAFGGDNDYNNPARKQTKTADSVLKVLNDEKRFRPSSKNGKPNAKEVQRKANNNDKAPKKTKKRKVTFAEV